MPRALLKKRVAEQGKLPDFAAMERLCHRLYIFIYICLYVCGYIIAIYIYIYMPSRNQKQTFSWVCANDPLEVELFFFSTHWLTLKRRTHILSIHISPWSLAYLAFVPFALASSVATDLFPGPPKYTTTKGALVKDLCYSSWPWWCYAYSCNFLHCLNILFCGGCSSCRIVLGLGVGGSMLLSFVASSA